MFLKCTILRLYFLYFVLSVCRPAGFKCFAVIRQTAASYRIPGPLGFVSGPNLPVAPEIRAGTRLFERRKYHFNLRDAGKFRIKPKTNRSVAKRFKITATGKLMYRRVRRRHRRGRPSVRHRRNGVITSVRMIRKITGVLHNR